MSDLLTHFAVFDDVWRIARACAQVDPAIKAAMTEQSEFARLGALTRSGNRLMPVAMEAAKRGRERLATDAMLQRKLAFGLGLIAHYPADYFMKKLMKERTIADWGRADGEPVDKQDPRRQASIREISAYYDTHVFRKVYLEGSEAPFNRFLLAENETDAGVALELFVRSLFQRALLSSHTFSPDQQNLEAWLEKTIETVQPLYIDIELYVRIFQSPEPAKLEKYGVTSAFYRHEDAAVKLARGLQRGGSTTCAEIDAATAEGANSGGYGKAVALGVTCMRQVSAWWNEKGELPDISQG